MEIRQKAAELLGCVREKNPLVHHITNYVTANDCANIALAIGASPVMADDIHEVREITAKASSLVINLGTLNKQRLDAMLAAGEIANELGIPVVMDPVGVGASTFRMEAARNILEKIRLSVIKGNLSEIKALSGLEAHTRGVDSDEGHKLPESWTIEAAAFVKALALRLNAAVAVSGAIDLVVDAEAAYCVENGNVMMSKVTGTGCMCTTLIASYLGAGRDGLTAAIAGMVSMGIAGDNAVERLHKSCGGTGSLRMYMIDEIYRLRQQDIMERGKIYEV